MNLGSKVVLTAILAWVSLDSARAATREVAPGAVPAGLDAVAVQLRAYLPESTVSTLLAQFAGLAGGSSALTGIGADGISLRVTVERGIASAAPAIPVREQRLLTDSILKGLSAAPSPEALPVLAPDAAAADPSAVAEASAAFSPDLERQLVLTCDAAVAEYRALVRNGQASPSGEDIQALAGRAAAGFGDGVREVLEARIMQRILSPDPAVAAADGASDASADPAADPAAEPAGGRIR